MAHEIKSDYCIAGGGIAGAILATKLANAGARVVMLEQGPRFTEDDRSGMIERQRRTLNDYADYNDGLDGRSVSPHTSAPGGKGVARWAHQRLFGIGGTALHFEGIMVRPREDDLRVRSFYKYGRDWPITYGELEPWLLEAERETGVTGNDENPYASPRSGPYPMPAHEFSYFDREIYGPALKRLGITGHFCPRAINSRMYRNRAQCQACRVCKFCPTGARYSPDRVHFKVLDLLPNVKVLENMSLRRLEVGGEGRRIMAAHAVRTDDETPFVVRAERFILAMGGVETPRMLLLSAGTGAHREGLGNMGGQLGRHLSDHFHPFRTYDVGRPVGSRLGFETMLVEHFRVNVDRRESPTFMLFAAPAMDWFPIGNEAAMWAMEGDVLSLDALRGSIARMATISGMMELEGMGVIDLDPEKVDAFGDPVARVTMNISDWERRNIENFKNISLKIGEAMGVRHASDVSRDLGMGYHPSGTTAMANTPDEGVCDPNLKVFGLENLYLASNSVFPHMGANAPTLTIAALALRLAAHLEGRAMT